MSTAPLVKAALTALWGPLLPAGLVGPLYAAISPGERIAIGDVSGTSEPITLGPNRQMEENYEIRCAVSVTVAGTPDDFPATTARVLAIFDVIEAALRAVPGQNAGVAGVRWAYIAGTWSTSETPPEEVGGRVNATHEFSVRVAARYSL